jgi:hypothetical protein
MPSGQIDAALEAIPARRADIDGGRGGIGQDLRGTDRDAFGRRNPTGAADDSVVPPVAAHGAVGCRKRGGQSIAIPGLAGQCPFRGQPRQWPKLPQLVETAPCCHLMAAPTLGCSFIEADGGGKL